MNKKEFNRKDYSSPCVEITAAESGSHLLVGSKMGGGHEDADDEEFINFSPGQGGHEDASDESW